MYLIANELSMGLVLIKVHIHTELKGSSFIHNLRTVDIFTFLLLISDLT